jgi:hypothetical protein
MSDFSEEVKGNQINLDDVSTVQSEQDLLDALGIEGTPNPATPKKAENKAGKPAAPAKEKEEEDEDEMNLILTGKKKKVEKEEEEDEEEDEEDDGKASNKKKGKKSDDDGISIGDEDEEEDEEENTDSVIHYINKANGLKLNLEKLPEDLDAKGQGKIVSGIIQRIVDNANTQLSKYRGIENLLKDEEVKLVLQAKKEGKSLKDIAAQYVTTYNGMSDDDVVRADLKKKYPSLADTEITDMVQDYTKKGLTAKMATAVREENKKNETLSTQQELDKKALKKQQEEEEYEEIVENYAGYVHKVNKVYGVPLTKEMKREAFLFSTVRDKDGMSALDYALQSDEGMLLATLGIKFLNKLVRNASTTSTNKSRKDILELVYEEREGQRCRTSE